jgi:hypothetical protein
MFSSLPEEISWRHKNFRSFLAASLLPGFACYLTSYFLIFSDVASSCNRNITVAVTGLVGAYLRPYFISLEQKQKDMISEMVRKNLNRKQKGFVARGILPSRK